MTTSISTTTRPACASSSRNRRRGRQPRCRASPGSGFYYYAGAAFDWLSVGETTVDTVTYTVVDRHGATAIRRRFVTVSGSNDLPLATADAATGDEDTPVLIDVVANDRDPDVSDHLRVASINGVRITPGFSVILDSGAIVSLAGNGSLRYDPAGRFDHLAPGQSAIDEFVYTVTDDHGGSAEAWASVTISGRNDGPRPGVDAVVIDEDQWIYAQRWLASRQRR